MGKESGHDLSGIGVVDQCIIIKAKIFKISIFGPFIRTMDALSEGNGNLSLFIVKD